MSPHEKFRSSLSVEGGNDCVQSREVSNYVTTCNKILFKINKKRKKLDGS